MIKLLKDEIAFLRGELSLELRSNQKTTEVLVEQNSHYQTHQRRCDEFQHNNQNQCTSHCIKYARIQDFTDSYSPV